MKKLSPLAIAKIIAIAACIIGLIVWFSKNKAYDQCALFTTERITKRPLSQTVTAGGDLEVKNAIKIGSIISGVVKDLHVQENDIVSEGQLLLTVDPGTGETEFEQAFNDYLKAKYEYLYKSKHFTRKAAIYKANQLSRDEYELLEKDTLVAEHSYKSAKAKLDREKLLLSERSIYAPQGGTITKVTVNKGSGVTGSNVYTSEPLIEIAPDFSDLETRLNIDESEIGLIKDGQKVKVTFNAYQDQPVFTTVKSIGFSVKKINDAQFYRVTADLHNPDKKFLPGMVFHAKIYVAEKQEAQSLHGFAFQIDPKCINLLAKKIGYSCKSLDKATRKKIRDESPAKRIKFVWVKEHNSFIQKPVTIGIVNDNYFEILEGLSESDEVVTNIAEENIMKNVYKKWFDGPL